MRQEIWEDLMTFQRTWMTAAVVFGSSWQTRSWEEAMSRRIWNTVATILTALAVGLGSAARGEDTIKIGYTDPLSGPFAVVGQQLLQQAQYAVDYINEKGGALGRKFELVAYDNKSQPSEELIALKSITDQRMPFVFQTAGSNIG